MFERVQRRTVSRGRQAKSERLLARLGVLRCGTCASRMVINSYSGNYRCGDTSADRCQRRAAVKADRVEAMVLDAVRAYSATADAHGRASRRQQIRAADEAIERANADLDDTIRQLGELGLLGRPASQQTLEKMTMALDDAHSARARLGDAGESNVIGPDEIDKLPRTREAVSGLAPADKRHRRVSHGRAGDDGGWAPQSPLGSSPDRHQVPRRASIRKPPAATSRASADTPGRTPHNSADRRRVRRRRRAGLAQPREDSKGRSTSPVRRDSSPAAATRGVSARWLLGQGSDSVVRLQTAADRAASKHIDDSRNRGRAGALADATSHSGRRRRRDTRDWRWLSGKHGHLYGSDNGSFSSPRESASGG